jgi:hypothetical protein
LRIDGYLLLLSETQMRRIEPYFPLSHGVTKVDGQRVISGIIFVIRNDCGGAMRRVNMTRTRPITASCAEPPLFPARIGRTKVGLNSKLHAVCDGQGV